MTRFLITLVVGVLVATWLAGCTAADATAKPSPMTGTTKITHADPAEAALMVEAKRVAVLDLRTPEEFAAGHIAGAKLVDFNAPDFEQQLSQLDRRKTWLVHCAGGGRSTKALQTFQKLGFRSVVHLDGGFNAWRKDGKPVVK